MKRWEHFYELLSKTQPKQSNATVSLYVFTKEQFSMKKSFRSRFLNNILYTLCNQDIALGYANDACQRADHIVLAIRKENTQVYGIAFVRIHDFDTFAIKNQPICKNVYGVVLEPRPNISHLLYVSMICGFSNSKCDDYILEFLTKFGFSEFRCDVVALHSIPSKYTYYVKRGFYRTLDMSNIYPAFMAEDGAIFNNSVAYSNMRNHFNSSSEFYSQVFFHNEYNTIYTTFQFLFMKPCSKGQLGGRSFRRMLKTKIDEVLHNAQRSDHRKTLCHKLHAKCA